VNLVFADYEKPSLDAINIRVNTKLAEVKRKR